MELGSLGLNLPPSICFTSQIQAILRRGRKEDIASTTFTVTIIKSAVSASEKLRVDTTDKIDSVLKLLRTHGLTRSQINNFVTKRPSGDLGDTLEPNLKLFKSLGITGANLAEMLNKEHRVLESDAYATVEFFRTNGFSDSQIKSITVKRPKFYVYNLKKCMKPKLEFFKSLGFAELQMAKFLSSQPYILERSLENHIIPCIEILRRVLDTDENVLKAIRAGCLVLEYDIEKVLEPNIAILVNHGVPKSLVVKLMLIQPRTLLQSTARLNKIIDEVKKLGFDPTNLLFVLAIRSMAVMSKALWEKKLEAYMNFGLTKDEVYSAFRRQPMFMIVSEQKISKLMDCYVNKLSMEPLIISKHPYLLLFSLEKRILPRVAVHQGAIALSTNSAADELPSYLGHRLFSCCSWNHHPGAPNLLCNFFFL
ncbi:hypothetical protein CUMW_131240 [Citrus unshiu]|uniref:Uncharacterized protein n=1 Tax=Citrus unshiu TaxID=55188 RepID=A0A2H5PFA0_CITUN|nr:hypothetical protein CUMW_131240 [Citrus unshiu]